MKKIEKYGMFCRSWEGGWSNHPNDPGGATMRGVTYKTFCAYRKSKGKPEPTLAQLRNISAKEWNEILREGYWDKVKADKINDQWVTFLIVDCVWMSGPGYIKNIQRILGLTDDGIVGPKTLAKLNSMNGAELFNTLWEQREQFFRRIGVGKKAVFLKGWLNRLKSIHYGYLMTNGGRKIVN